MQALVEMPGIGFIDSTSFKMIRVRLFYACVCRLLNHEPDCVCVRVCVCVCVYVLVCLISCLYCYPAAAFSGTSVRKYEIKKDGPRDGTCKMRRYVVA